MDGGEGRVNAPEFASVSTTEQPRGCSVVVHGWRFMEFVFRPLGWRDTQAVADWRYPSPYELYDLSRSALLVGAGLHRLLAPLRVVGFYAVQWNANPLAGVFSFRRMGTTVELGLGLRPDLTGRSIGLAFVEAGMVFARETLRLPPSGSM